MLTIVFYATDGQQAKMRAREICAESKSAYARVYDVSAWEGKEDKCDAVEIMPDVPGWQRERITSVFGKVEEVIPSGDAPPVEDPARKQLGLMPPKEDIATPTAKVAKHRGGGRWFVMVGDEVISGPHEKAEAQRLAAEE